MRFSMTQQLGMQALRRRGYDLGFVASESEHGAAVLSYADIKRAWQADETVFLPELLAAELPSYVDDIARSHAWMEQVLQGVSLEESLEQGGYAKRLQPEFSLVASVIEEHDEQGIEKVFFDALVDDDVVAEDLWCKASWLSFVDDDASLRFRFSFGMEGYEDVAADPHRQRWASRLTDVLFPESKVVTDHPEIAQFMAQALDAEQVMFAEKIVYFNAPNGGAQMHHDVEPGHAGVLFAQLSGSTFWLSLGKQVLIDELIAFVQDETHAANLAAVLPAADDRSALMSMLQDRARLSAYMDEFDHELVEAVFDRSPAFIGYLVARGYAYILNPGDVLLMPQRDLEYCVWHSVFCLGDEPGEGLSFAMRAAI